MALADLQTLEENEILQSSKKHIKMQPSVVKTKSKEEKNNFIYYFLKRTVDIIGGTVGIFILIPMTIIIYIANRICKDNGPVFYVQDRIGKNGKIFKMYKYRSMIVDSEKILQQHLLENEEARNEYKINKKLKNDPRITRIGKFIRKTSIDELPQLVNVLKGDMSLVRS